jgi:hypothetical protein
MSNRTAELQGGYALAQVARPTEKAALRNTTQTTPNAPDLLALFDGILTAQANGDAHGVSLLGHTIARLAGPNTGKASR